MTWTRWPMPDDRDGSPATTAAAPASHELLEQLRYVIDPELGIDIVALGLVYQAGVVDGVAHVRLTTTTPACPVGSYLTDAVRWALLHLERVDRVEVELTHEPRWTPGMMSDEAKARLGWRP